MASDSQPVTIKKYANRRLYHTGTSTYVTLEDLAVMVKKGDDFVVYDAKSSDDITRSVLAQIIFEQESKEGQNLLPITFLRQLIRFYGDSLQSLVPSYLEMSIGKLTSEQQTFRDLMAQTFGGPGLASPSFSSMEELTRRNMNMFSQALGMFNPFAVGLPQAKNAVAAGAEVAAAAKPSADEFDLLKKQINDMQEKIAELASKG